MKLTKPFSLCIALCFAAGTSFAQEETPADPMDTLAKSVSKLQSDLSLLKRIKVSGYMQPQFQYIDSAGANTVVGPNFPAHTDKRFTLRRARVKIAYEMPLSQYVFQIDATERGFAIKDMYARFTEPWARAFSITMGCMNRPFGHEIGYSSSMRESPERGRMSQIIFPGEREVGAMLTFQMPKTSKLNFVKLEAGMFNGTGPTASDFDFQKDIIGRLGIARTTRSEKISYGLGFSYYDGGVQNGKRNVFHSIGALSNGNTGWLPPDTLASNLYGVTAISKRTYIGADMQLTFDLPIGLTSIRAEYIQGQQPGTSSSTTSPSAQPTTETYIRNFDGAYFYFIYNILQSRNQIVFKYDWYDPNTDVAGGDIGKSGSALTAADVKYTTMGFGWAYRIDGNVKLTAYYDMVTNEKTPNLTSSGTHNDLKDNVFTFRLQYKF